jgi:hypothetical protein
LQIMQTALSPIAWVYRRRGEVARGVALGLIGVAVISDNRNMITPSRRHQPVWIQECRDWFASAWDALHIGSNRLDIRRVTVLMPLMASADSVR